MPLSFSQYAFAKKKSETTSHGAISLVSFMGQHDNEEF
jgi:hypothetical protein